MLGCRVFKMFEYVVHQQCRGKKSVGGGTTRNRISQRIDKQRNLFVKDGDIVLADQILAKQRNLVFYPGQNVMLTDNYSLKSILSGQVYVTYEKLSPHPDRLYTFRSKHKPRYLPVDVVKLAFWTTKPKQLPLVKPLFNIPHNVQCICYPMLAQLPIDFESRIGQYLIGLGERQLIQHFNTMSKKYNDTSIGDELSPELSAIDTLFTNLMSFDKFNNVQQFINSEFNISDVIKLKISKSDLTSCVDLLITLRNVMKQDFQEAADKINVIFSNVLAQMVTQGRNIDKLSDQDILRPSVVDIRHVFLIDVKYSICCK
ncbi:hypothetical protein GJ496_009094 [Pomphorhynchus laevis]|nr:hypothetical protein GJ496_009094 [Pomphorhynchus laevis]